jgi:hypothetical protein
MKRMLIVLLAVFPFAAAQGEYFGFYAITSNDPSGHSQEVGETQLSMEVSLINSSRFRLVISNEGPDDAVVSNIYFDYASYLGLGLADIISTDGVSFHGGRSTPSNLPAGKSIGNIFESDFAVSAYNPKPHLGINPGESLELLINNADGADVIGALGSEDLRVGLHVISLGEYSESFVNVVPEPATFSISMFGAFILRMLRIRRTKRRKRITDDFEPVIEERDELAWVEIRSSRRDRRTMPLTSAEAAIWKTVR